MTVLTSFVRKVQLNVQFMSVRQSNSIAGLRRGQDNTRNRYNSKPSVQFHDTFNYRKQRDMLAYV